MEGARVVAEQLVDVSRHEGEPEAAFVVLHGCIADNLNTKI